MRLKKNVQALFRNHSYMNAEYYRTLDNRKLLVVPLATLDSNLLTLLCKQAVKFPSPRFGRRGRVTRIKVVTAANIVQTLTAPLPPRSVLETCTAHGQNTSIVPARSEFCTFLFAYCMSDKKKHVTVLMSSAVSILLSPLEYSGWSGGLAVSPRYVSNWISLNV